VTIAYTRTGACARERKVSRMLVRGSQPADASSSALSAELPRQELTPGEARSLLALHISRARARPPRTGRD
jgi:hypothetical protein